MNSYKMSRENSEACSFLNPKVSKFQNEFKKSFWYLLTFIVQYWLPMYSLFIFQVSPFAFGRQKIWNQNISIAIFLLFFVVIHRSHKFEVNNSTKRWQGQFRSGCLGSIADILCHTTWTACFVRTLFNLCLLTLKQINLVKIYLLLGKSMSEALIFASTNPQYDNRLFIDFPGYLCLLTICLLFS